MTKQMTVTLILALTVGFFGAQFVGQGNFLPAIALVAVLWVLTVVFIRQHNIYENKQERKRS